MISCQGSAGSSTAHSILTAYKQKASSFGWGPFTAHNVIFRTQPGRFQPIAQSNVYGFYRRSRQIALASRYMRFSLESGRGRNGESKFSDGLDSLRAHGVQPPRGKPGARYGELGPAAIQAYKNIRRRRHGRMAQRARTVAIETNFRRDRGYSFRLALRADHGYTSRFKNFRGNPNNRSWEQDNCNLAMHISTMETVQN